VNDDFLELVPRVSFSAGHSGARAPGLASPHIRPNSSARAASFCRFDSDGMQIIGHRRALSPYEGSSEALEPIAMRRPRVTALLSPS
jgi:hypothetical protein